MKKISVLAACCILACGVVCISGCGMGNISQTGSDAVNNESESFREDDFSDGSESSENKNSSNVMEVQENKSESIEVLLSKEYYINSDSFNFSLTRANEKDSLSVFADINDKSDAFDTQIALTEIMSDDDENLRRFIEYYNFSYSISVGDGALIIVSNNSSFIMKDGNFISFDDYYSDDWINTELHESDYGEAVAEFMTDFINNI